MQHHEAVHPQTFVGFFGPPGVGKTTLAKLIAPRLEMTHLDIDDVRKTYFGAPVPNDGTDPKIKAQDDREMGATYDILFAVIGGFMRAERPLLLTCTLSSEKHGQDRLVDAWRRYGARTRLRVIWLWPELTPNELAERFRDRAATGYVGATTDPKRAWELRERYNPLNPAKLPHLKLNTGPGHSPEESAEEVIRYILCDQMHDFAELTP